MHSHCSKEAHHTYSMITERLKPPEQLKSVVLRAEAQFDYKTRRGGRLRNNYEQVVFL